MEHLNPSDLQNLLEEEATTLQIMHTKIANQIHLLQVEEELLRQELAKVHQEDHPNPDSVQGVNQIVEVTNEDVAEEGGDAFQITDRGRADGVQNIVEIASDDLELGVSGIPEAPHENGTNGVNQIVEITDDEDAIMREISTEDYGGAMTPSLPWSEQVHASDLEYEILEPSSDESEPDGESSYLSEERTIANIFPTSFPGIDVREKRQREEGAEPECQLNSEMEVEEDSDNQVSPAISPVRSPPRKKQTPRRKTLGS